MCPAAQQMLSDGGKLNSSVLPLPYPSPPVGRDVKRAALLALLVQVC